MSRLLLLLLPFAVHAQSVRVTVDRDEVAVLDVVTLRVDASGGNVEAPDLEAAGWRLVGRNQGVSMVNGRVSSQLTLRLQALRAGNLKIDAFRVRANGGIYKSKPIAVKVRDDGGGASTAGAKPSAAARDEHAWVEWDVDRPTVWLGEEVRARLYLFIDPRVRLSNVDTSDLDLKGWWTEHSGQRRRAQRQVQIEDVAYNRLELGFYHLFPLRAGKLDLPAVTVSLRQSRGFFDDSRGSRAKRTAEPLTVTVRALPTERRPPGFAGPAVGDITLRAAVDRRRINADEGVQLTVETRIRGGRIEATPEVALPPIPGFKVFPPTADSKSEVKNGQTRGFRRQRWLLRPKKGGQLTIPALRLPYFHPSKGRYETARSGPIRITVRGRPDAVESGRDRKKARKASKGPALHTVRKDVDLDARDRPFHATVWFWLALFLPPLGFLALVARDGALAHLGATAGERAARKAAAVATAELGHVPRDPETAYGAIARALLTFLEARFGQSFRGLTHAQLGCALEENGVEASTVGDLVAELENCDFARFAPSADAGAVDAAVERASALVQRIEASA